MLIIPPQRRYVSVVMKSHQFHIILIEHEFMLVKLVKLVCCIIHILITLKQDSKARQTIRCMVLRVRNQITDEAQHAEVE